jgi:hypothetical protein
MPRQSFLRVGYGIIRRRELLAADRNQAQKGGSMQLNTDVTKALAPR